MFVTPKTLIWCRFKATSQNSETTSLSTSFFAWCTHWTWRGDCDWQVVALSNYEAEQTWRGNLAVENRRCSGFTCLEELKVGSFTARWAPFLSATMCLLPLERCWAVLEQRESLLKKKKNIVEQLNPVAPLDAGLLYVIHRMNALRPRRIPDCEQVRVGLRSDEDQVWQGVDTNDWVTFVSFENSFYSPDPCDQLKKKMTAFPNAQSIPWIRPWGKCGAYTLIYRFHV